MAGDKLKIDVEVLTAQADAAIRGLQTRLNTLIKQTGDAINQTLKSPSSAGFFSKGEAEKAVERMTVKFKELQTLQSQLSARAIRPVVDTASLDAAAGKAKVLQRELTAAMTAQNKLAAEAARNSGMSVTWKNVGGVTQPRVVVPNSPYSSFNFGAQGGYDPSKFFGWNPMSVPPTQRLGAKVMAPNSPYTFFNFGEQGVYDPYKFFSQQAAKVPSGGGGGGVAALDAAPIQSVTSRILSMATAWVTAEVAMRAFRAGWDAVVGTFTGALLLMDEIRAKTASMAGAMVISDPSIPFDKALANADAVIKKVYVLQQAFIGTGRELMILAEAMTTFGVQLDFTTKKGGDQFVAFANLLKIITAGQNFEIQAFQEIRALMQGQNFQGAMLARRLQAAGVEVQKVVPEWIKQGVFIEKILGYLHGYERATFLIQGNLETQRKTMLSVAQLIAAEGMSEAYYDIRDALVEINKNLLDEGFQNILKGKLADGWKTFKGYVLDTYDILKMMKNVLSEIGDAVTPNVKTGNSVIDWVTDLLTGKVARRTLGRIAEFARDTNDYIEGQRMAKLLGYTGADIQGKGMYFKGLIQQGRIEAEGFKFDRGTPTGEPKTPAGGAGKPDKAGEAKAKSYAKRLKKAIMDADIEFAKAVEYTEGSALEQSIRKHTMAVHEKFSAMYDPEEIANVMKSGTEEQKATVKEWWTAYYKAQVAARQEAINEVWGKYNKASQEYSDKVRDMVLTQNESFESMIREYQPGDGVSRWLKDQTDKIEKATKDAQLAVLKTALGAPLTPYGTVPLSVTRSAAKRYMELEGMGEGVQGAAETEALRRRKEIFAELQERLRQYRKEASIPVSWPWNERTVAITQGLADASKQYNEALIKLRKEMELNADITPEMYAEQEKALRDRMNNTIKNVLEQQNFVLQATSEVWTGWFKSMEDSFASLFNDALTGKLKSFKDYFQSFVGSIVSIWSRAVAEMIVKSMMFGKMGSGAKMGFGDIMGFIFGLLGIGGAEAKPHVHAAASGGIFPGHFVPIRAFAGGGIANRPTFGLIAEAGESEAVIPMKGGKVPVDLRGGGRGSVEVNFNIVAADTKDFDRLLVERRSLISGIIRQELSSAGHYRDAMRRYV